MNNTPGIKDLINKCTTIRYWVNFFISKTSISHDVVSRSGVTPCTKIDKPLVVLQYFRGHL